MSVMCVVCDKIFSKRSNLNRHRRELHGLERNPVLYDKSVWNYKCLESNCNNSYRNNEMLIQHLQQVHNILFENAEEIVFKNINEFESWKTNYEMKNKCNYTVARTWKSTDGKVIYYNCNRSKTGKQYQQQRQRLLKSQGSCKLDFMCPSHLKLKHDENKLYVTLQKTHYGHSLDLQHLRISKDDRSIILTSKHTSHLISKNFPEENDNIIMLPSSQAKNNSNNNLINKVNQTFLKLQTTNLNDLDDSTILEIHMHLNIINNLINLPQSSNHDFKDKTGNTIFNENVPQLRFSSTQKRENVKITVTKNQVGNKK